MAGRDTRMSHRARRRLIANIRATQPVCHLCGQPIDVTRDPQRDPLGSVVDEFIPRARGGDPLDPTNCFHAHRVCNGWRGTRPVTAALKAEIRARLGVAIGSPSRRW